MVSRMSREERAKQFMPFAALKGYEMALREKERIVVSKVELSEDYREELDYRMQQLEKNDIVEVVYFCKGEYLKITGMVSKKDESARILKVVNTNIAFSDIFQMDILKKYENK